MKKNARKYSAEFKRKAVEQMRTCDSVVGLAQRLGVRWRQLYRWKEELAAAEAVGSELDEAEVRLKALEEENARLKLALADKVLEADFFSGALRKIEARRRSKDGTGASGSSSKSSR